MKIALKDLQRAVDAGQVRFWTIENNLEFPEELQPFIERLKQLERDKEQLSAEMLEKTNIGVYIIPYINIKIG